MKSAGHRWSKSFICCVWVERKTNRHPNTCLPMDNTTNESRYSARPVDRQAGRVLSPEPRQDSPPTTGRNLPQRKRNARLILQGPKPTTGKSTKTNKTPSSAPRPGNYGRKTPKKPFPLTITHFNICGIATKKDEFKTFLHENKVHVALLQETQHVAETNINITGYTPYPCDCKNCQGSITYIRNDITGKVTNINTCQPTIIQKAEIWHAGCKYVIYNLYNPPSNHLNLTPTFGTSQFVKTVIAGDFNGRSPSWGYSDTNQTGKFIETFCNTTNLFRMQDSETPPTHFHRVHKTLNRPDLTLVSADLMQKTSSKVTDGIGSSDHFPTIVTIEAPCPRKFEKWTRWNFKKANWEEYKTTSNTLLKELDLSGSDVNKNTTIITEAILTAAKKCIPRGCRSNYKPFWNNNLAQAVKSREEARKKFMENPTPENRTDFMKTSAYTKKQILSSKRQKFQQTCENLDLSKEGTKAWSLLKNMNGENKKTNPKPIVDEGDTIADDQKKAERHNKYFASTNKANKITDEDKTMLNDLKTKEKSPGPNAQIFEENFSNRELEMAMRKLKSRKSPGPDGIHNEMLTHLGNEGKQVILNLINMTWTTGELPKSWKVATVKPLLKKGKPAEEISSYRPISLTSCLGKLAERMTNARLYWWLEANQLLNVHQAGFRKGQRTEDLLFRMTQQIIDGFHQKKSTVGIFVDLQQAYDRVWRKGLFIKMQNIGIHGNLYKWIKNFLSDRLIQTKVHNAFSSKCVLEEGLPQGSSLSCTLFLIFLNDLPKILKSEKAQYADDLAFWQTQNKAGTCAILLNEDLQRLDSYCKKWKLKINTTKTVYTIFSKSPDEAKKNLQIKIGGNEVTKEYNPTYLGVQLDRQLTLAKHIANLKLKSSRRLKIIKRLASTKWGADKANLRQIYLGYVRSVMEHSLALQNICSKSVQESLDKVQNEAVKFISGGMKSTPIAACEIDSNIEPLNLRREAAALDMVERYKRSDIENPNNKIVNHWEADDRIKQKSIMKVEKHLQEKHHLPSNRAPITPNNNELPPNKALLTPVIKLDLVEKISKSNSDSVELNLIGNKTITSYTDFHQIFTDGSAFKGTLNAGFGARIEYLDKECDEISEPCGVHCSNFEAEAFAMNSAIEKLKETFKENPTKINNCVIFSDSRSCLESLKMQNLENTAIRDLCINISSFLKCHKITLVLQWIPSHCNLQGNERADILAKKGAEKEQINKPVSQTTAKQIIKSNTKIDWLNSWANCEKGRSMFKHVPKPNTKDEINLLNRKDQVIIFRLRTTHIQLNFHLSRITKDHPPTCTLCGYKEETVQHFLFDCPSLQDLRKEFLPQSPSLENTLYTDKLQLLKTSKYFQKANQRRTPVQA